MAAPALTADHDVVIGPRHKGFPAGTWGTTVGELGARRPTLAEFSTPLLTLDTGVVDANLDAVRRWTAERGLDLAPHGKTTMSPTLWRRMLDRGAVAITLATPWQVQVARAAGIRSIMLANTLVDPAGIRWIAAELDADPDLALASWVDSVEAVRLLADVRRAAGAVRPQDVVVELGATGGRTGARGVAAALDVARAVVASPSLRLAGCGGYEGALAHDRSDAALAAVRGYLADVATLHGTLLAEGLYETDRVVVTEGGSAYLDVVADELGPLVDPAGERGTPTSVVLRSGAYIAHDDGFYRGISPLDGGAAGASPNDANADAPRLSSAMHAFVRVVSRPEPGLALLDGGKRDLPFDEGLPVPQRVLGLGREASEAALAGARITALNDQHAFLHLGPAARDALPVGSVVRLGLSHPCTAFDKWRLVPLVEDAAADDPVVVDAVATYF
ncbi:MAG: amino acid deaminase [Salana multivorans]|uniref:amino acid deaminase n=1 Tax=Salana multivorans TaxID=120377 RepID=UPI000967F572|nr:amino acid deaminase [Salana multivorans]MBN8882515.1 amino acid deaminase [Salana multivorans]OJX95741.1 MAG: amino acid deaminase [Micrococcales bacterium 73-15]